MKILPKFSAASFAGKIDSEVRDFYRTNSALQVANFFTHEDFLPLQRSLARQIGLLEKAKGFSVGNGYAVQDLSDRIQALVDQYPELQSVLYDVVGCLPDMHQFASSNKVINFIAQLLETEAVGIHSRLIVLMNLPDATWHLASWHQDWYYNKGPESTVTAYIPLQYTSEVNGALQLALGETARGALQHGDHEYGHESKWHRLEADTVASFENVVQTEVDRGDALFFHSLTPHSPLRNRSSHIRFVINLRYRDLADENFVNNGWKPGDLSQAREALARKGALE